MVLGAPPPPQAETLYQQTQNIGIPFIQCWSNFKDVGPTLYKCYTNVLCLLGVCGVAQAPWSHVICNHWTCATPHTHAYIYDQRTWATTHTDVISVLSYNTHTYRSDQGTSPELLPPSPPPRDKIYTICFVNMYSEIKEVDIFLPCD